MKETLVMAKWTDMESLKIETIKSYMMDTGVPTKNMDQAQRTMVLAHTTRANTTITKDTELAPTNSPMDQFISVIGVMIWWLDKENLERLMELCTKASFSMVKKRAKEWFNTPMARIMTDTLRMANTMALAF